MQLPDDLTAIPGSPGYAISATGRVHKFGRSRLGLQWFQLRPTEVILKVSSPGHVSFRRTGSFYFPIFCNGTFERRYWTPNKLEPACPLTTEATDDDCPF